jgi:hypothetical protein
VVIGHSIGFDLAVLKKECDRAGGCIRLSRHGADEPAEDPPSRRDR